MCINSINRKSSSRDKKDRAAGTHASGMGTIKYKYILNRTKINISRYKWVGYKEKMCT